MRRGAWRRSSPGPTGTWRAGSRVRARARKPSRSTRGPSSAPPSFRWAHESLVSLFRRERESLRAGPLFDRLIPSLRKSLASGTDLPQLRDTLALALLHGETERDVGAAAEVLAPALEATARRNPAILATLAQARFLAGDAAEAVRALEEAVAIPGAKRSLFPLLADFRRAALPDLPTFGSVDAALASCGGGPEAGRQLERGFWSLEKGSRREAVALYLEARLLEMEGEPLDAAERFAEAAVLEAAVPEPVLARARCLAQAGDARMAAEVLRDALSTCPPRRELWDRWVEISFVDLQASPADLLERFPCAPTAESHDAADLRDLLQDLDRGAALRIDCRFSWPQERGQVPGWGRDRFHQNCEAPFVPSYEDPYIGEVQGTEEDALYLSQRWFPGDEVAPAGYRIPLPPGRFRVTLHFAELYHLTPGLRRFGVRLEGEEVLSDFDPGAKGFAVAQQLPFDREVRDGMLEIELVPRVGVPCVSAIEVERVEP